MIRGISKVVLEVDDQERARDFWTRVLGFELHQDEPYGDERWLEVRAPDGSVNVVLDVRHSAPHSVPSHLPTSNVFFSCDDLMTTFEELRTRGVRFPQPPVQQPFGWWCMFEDPDGNRFALGVVE